MGFFDKLMFWKPREPDLGGMRLPGEEPGAFAGLGEDMGMGGGFGKPGLTGQGFGQPGPTGQDLGAGFPSMGASKPAAHDFPEPSPPSSIMGPPSQQGFSQTHDIVDSKNYEVMLSKMDALSAQMESINQRLRTIERIALEEEKKSHERTW